MMPLCCPAEDKGAGHSAAEGKIPRELGPMLPFGPTCCHLIFTLPSCTFRPPIVAVCALWPSALLQMKSSLATHEIYLETGSYSKERVESLFPSSMDGMNK